MQQALGNQLRLYRESLGLSRADVAAIIGRDPSVVGKIEAGSVAISAASLITLRTTLGLSLDWLVEQLFPEPLFLDDRHEGRGPEVSFFTRMPRDAGRTFDCVASPSLPGLPLPPAVQHAGAEYIQLTRGELLVTIGLREVHLWRTSSVLRIPPWVEHSVRLATDELASFRWTMSEEGEDIHTAEAQPRSKFMDRVLQRSAERQRRHNESP